MNKQLTIDFINQSSSHICQTSEGHSNEQTEFADRLGQMNCCYQALSSDVTEKLKQIEMIKVKWQEYDKHVKKLQTWFVDQNEKFQQCCVISNEMSVKQAFTDCKVGP